MPTPTSRSLSAWLGATANRPVAKGFVRQTYAILTKQPARLCYGRQDAVKEVPIIVWMIYGCRKRYRLPTGKDVVGSCFWIIAAALGCQTAKPLLPPLAPVPEMLGPARSLARNQPPTSDSSQPATLPGKSGWEISPAANAPDRALPDASPNNTSRDVPTLWQNANTDRNPGSNVSSTVESKSLLAARQRAEAIYRRLASIPSRRKIPQRIIVTPDAQPRISVRSAEELVISAGLVQSCASENQLAGVLALALSDWLAKHAPARNVSELEPLDLRIGSESNTYGELPLLRQAELVKTGYAHRAGTTTHSTQAETLARQIYEGAGFSEREFGQARALYQQARRN